VSAELSGTKIFVSIFLAKRLGKIDYINLLHQLVMSGGQLTRSFSVVPVGKEDKWDLVRLTMVPAEAREPHDEALAAAQQVVRATLDGIGLKNTPVQVEHAFGTFRVCFTAENFNQNARGLTAHAALEYLYDSLSSVFAGVYYATDLYSK
jgi:hypothetical protein